MLENKTNGTLSGGEVKDVVLNFSNTVILDSNTIQGMGVCPRLSALLYPVLGCVGLIPLPRNPTKL
jgi:hypothetical protein